MVTVSASVQPASPAPGEDDERVLVELSDEDQAHLARIFELGVNVPSGSTQGIRVLLVSHYSESEYESEEITANIRDEMMAPTHP
jgi:hypothetical protein